jgi:chromosomal replication initiation ATPase DnaA
MTTPTLVMMEVCDKFKTTIKEITSTTRKHSVTDSRAAICYLLRKYSRLTLKEIGSNIRPDYDHTSVIYMIQKSKDLIDTEFDFRHNIQKCEAVISQKMVNETKYCPCCKQVIYDTTS